MPVSTTSLKKAPLFAQMTDQELTSLLPACTEEKAKRGTSLITQGVSGRDFFIIEDGQVVLEKLLQSPTSDTPRQTVIRTYGPGGMVGWSCITFDAYLATAVTGRDSSVVRVDSRKLLEILDAAPTVGYKFMSALAKSLSIQIGNTEDALLKERALVIEEVRKRAPSG